MSTHVKVLGWLHIALGSMGLLAGASIFLFFGGLAAVVGMTDHSSDVGFAVPILGGVGALVFVILLVLSIPGIIAGIGLLNLQPWARVLTIVLSAFELLHVPFGTALGVYGFWVLLQRDSERLFGVV
jgi:hypothetical protein